MYFKIFLLLLLVSNLQGKFLNLIKDNIYDLQWEVDVINQEIHFTLDVKHDGWVGIGLSPGGKMANSDNIICQKTNGKADCTDRWATRQALPKLDNEQGGKSDLTNVSCESKNERIIYKFTRKLSTGDSKDIEILKGKSLYIIYALGTMKSNGYFNCHSKYGSVEQVLWS